MVYSHLQYGIATWGGNLNVQQYGNELIKLHGKIVKNIFSNHFPHGVCYFKSAKILTLKDIHKYVVCVYMYKMIRLNEYISLQDSLELNPLNHNYLTRNRNAFILPFPRVESIRINYKYQFINTWNDLPDGLKNLNSLSSFKRKLKNFLIDSY